jgi:hypothetical protein
MGEIIRHSDTCSIEQVSTGKIVEGVVQDFKYQNRLVVILNKSVKLSLVWNGKIYEGRMAGLDFITAGPVIHRTKPSGRG